MKDRLIGELNTKNLCNSNKVLQLVINSFIAVINSNPVGNSIIKPSILLSKGRSLASTSYHLRFCLVSSLNLPPCFRRLSVTARVSFLSSLNTPVHIIDLEAVGME